MSQEVKKLADFPDIPPLSCRFCAIGGATYISIDKVKNEISGLCDKHKAEYSFDTDSIPAPVVEPEEKPE